MWIHGTMEPLYLDTYLVSIFCYSCFTLECMVGYYGYNCNISCDGCLSDSCDSDDGICTNVSSTYCNIYQGIMASWWK
jgi:hypothetical protein